MNRKPTGLILSFALALVAGVCGPKPTNAAESGAAQPAAATTNPAAALPKSIRIVAWNLEWFPGHKPEPTPAAEREQMAAAKAAIAELKPDVLLLEEIRDWESAAELCKAVPKMQVHVVSRFQPRPQNQVVASKLPADSTWSESWQADAVTPPRGYSFAALELPGPRFVLAYALHLKSNQGELPVNILNRQIATKQLLKHASDMVAIYGKRGPCAVVIGGDLNTSLDDPRFAQEQTLPALKRAGLHWTFEGVPFAKRTTIPASGEFADNCFDHIFTAGLGKPTAFVKSFPAISDHNPVVLDVNLSTADFLPKLDAAGGIALLDQSKITLPPPPQVSPGGPLAANDAKGIQAVVGKIATVKGRVQNVSSTNTNSIYFINFTGVPRGGFVGIIKKDSHDAIVSALGSPLSTALAGKEIELRGEIVLFKEAPQIVITAASQIKATAP